LATKLPGVEQVKVASTAAAAQVVSTGSTQPQEGESAAICSKVCIRVFPSLQVLEEGIQNENGMIIPRYESHPLISQPLTGGFLLLLKPTLHGSSPFPMVQT
jgi:hypothetical protein